MIIPIRTDRLPKRRPVVVEVIIALNLAVYMVMMATTRGDEEAADRFLDAWHFDPGNIRLYQLVTYQFLHDPGSIWHLVFNMLGLWVFGCAVESRLGRSGFAVFYLLAGIFAAVMHAAISEAPIIGASGAICGVTGAFLALFPRSNTIVLFLLTLSLMSIPSLWIIGFYIALDAVRQLGEVLGSAGQRVAYAAHLAGYFYGFWLAFTMLALRIIRREEFDAFYLWKQMRRRAVHREAVRDSVGGAWTSASADSAKRAHKAIAADKPDIADDAQRAQIRSEVHAAMRSHDLAAAADGYRRLLDQHADSADLVFSESQQLDLANQLSAEEKYEHASRAYELLLEHYPSSPRTPEVKLMLSVMYIRQLNRLQRARELLTNLPARLADAGHRKLAEDLLTTIIGR